VEYTNFCGNLSNLRKALTKQGGKAKEDMLRLPMSNNFIPSGPIHQASIILVGMDHKLKGF
jgi:hypothetical protein